MPRLPIAALASAAFFCLAAGAQIPGQRMSNPSTRLNVPAANPQSESPDDAQSELLTGSRLTRQGYLREAIPHLLVARRQGIAPYATGVNLAICYLGTGQYEAAASLLKEMSKSGNASATVYNLLAQAYLGTQKRQQAWQSFLRAADATPRDEKLYDFLADACTDQGDYSLGLAIVNRGLHALPNSARLHYERAVFISRLGDFEKAKEDFDEAAQLGPGTYIGTLATVQKLLYESEFAKAEVILHQAIKSGESDFRTLSLLGTVLLHEGAAPGDLKFAEAQAVLERSAQEDPNYSATQIALGQVYLMEDKPRAAIDHLEIGRRLDPDNPAVYASLASAWEKLGDRGKAAAMRKQMGKVLAQKAVNNPITGP